MDATVFIAVDGTPCGVSPLTDKRPKCLLPLAGKPLLVHAIEDLAMAGLKQVTILAGPNTVEIRNEISDGRRWGLEITVVGNADLTETTGWQAGQELLIVRGDMARSPVLARFLAWAEDRSEGRLSVRMGGQDAGILLIRPGVARSGEMSCDGAVSAIASLAEFHAANQAVLNGGYPGLLVEGRVVLDDGGDELIVGRGSRVHTDSLMEGQALIGAFTQVARSARLKGRVVIGRDCIIEAGTTIEDSVVMPGTYVGADLEVRGMIVAGHTLIKVDTGAITEIADPFLLSELAVG